MEQVVVKETFKATQAVKSYLRGLGLTMILYALGLVVAIRMAADDPSGWWMLLPFVPGLGVIGVVRRYYAASDEVIQFNMLNAFARAFAVAIVAIFGVSLASTFVIPFPEWSTWVAFVLPMIAWGAGGVLFDRRMK